MGKITIEQAANRKFRFMIIGGFADLIGAVAAAVVVLLCALLLMNLFSWVRGDIQSSFGDLTKTLRRAVVIGEEPASTMNPQ